MSRADSSGSSSRASWRSSPRCSAFFFVFYNIPAQWFAMHADPWPEDIQKRSYFTMGICGEGTERLCPDPALPMPGDDSGYINPDGNSFFPEGRRASEDRSLRTTGSDMLTQSIHRCARGYRARAVLPGGR